MLPPFKSVLQWNVAILYNDIIVFSLIKIFTMLYSNVFSYLCYIVLLMLTHINSFPIMLRDWLDAKCHVLINYVSQSNLNKIRSSVYTVNNQ